MADLALNLGTFAATSATMTATSEAGRAFLGTMFGAIEGVAPVSVGLPKSKASDLLRFAQQRGLAVA